MQRRLVLVAAAALVRGDGRVLLAQRPEGKPMSGLWEFPGGKVESGETPAIALARELSEELRISARVEDLRPFIFASHDYPDFHLLMPVFMCRNWSGDPSPAEGQAVVWASGDEIRDFAVPPADEVIIERYVQWWGTR